jgi:hypothetical protein
MVFTRRLQPQSRADKAPTGFGVPVFLAGSARKNQLWCGAAIAYNDLLGTDYLIKTT